MSTPAIQEISMPKKKFKNFPLNNQCQKLKNSSNYQKYQ